MANDRFRSMFFEEARELLQALEEGLMDLEARQGDRAHVDRTFRAAHTLKGAAGMVGLRSIAEFTHRVEAVLDRIRSGSMEVRPEIISTLLEAKDQLAAAVEAEAEGQAAPSAPESLVERLDALASGVVPAQPAAAPAVTVEGSPASEESAERAEAEAEAERAAVAEETTYRIVLAPRPDLLRRGVNPLGFLDELRELGRAKVVPDADRVPPLEEIDPRDCYLRWTVELTTTAGRERIDEVFLFLEDRSQVSIEVVAPGVEEKVAVAPEPAARNGEPEPEAKPASTVATQAPADAREVRAKAATGGRIRVEADQLDQLVGMAGELAVLTDSLQELREVEGVAPWSGTIEALERLGRRLRDTTLELRMVPIEELFVRFPRVVRDLAEHCGKQIALRLEGEETQLDRTIVERLADPMIHLIRNSVDHGLESPEERLAAGKPPTGRITIRAGHEGDRVTIQIMDDGRGLDRAKILRKGLALGLLPPDTSPDDPRVGTLIFEAGFSTREKVGELSGRGVGLDVVRDTIRSLRGSVSLRTEEGRGTTFRLSLPLTLAMIDGLLVEVDGARYVVPMGQVDECVAPNETDTLSAMGRRAVVVREEMVPIVWLRQAFGAEGPPPDRLELLLTRYAEQRVGVAVDRLLGRVQAVIQPLSEGLAHLRRFSGATILGDGSICLILDLATLVSEAQAREHHASLSAST